MALIAVLHVLTLVVLILLLVFYWPRVNRFPRIPPARRGTYRLRLLIGTFIAFPIYSWLYVRPDAPSNSG